MKLFAVEKSAFIGKWSERKTLEQFAHVRGFHGSAPVSMKHPDLVLFIRYGFACERPPPLKLHILLSPGSSRARTCQHPATHARASLS